MFLFENVKRVEKRDFFMRLESNQRIFPLYLFKYFNLHNNIDDYTLQNEGIKTTQYRTFKQETQH